MCWFYIFYLSLSYWPFSKQRKQKKVRGNCSIRSEIIPNLALLKIHLTQILSVCVFVCVLTPSPFMDLRAPNLAGRSGAGTKNTSRKRNFKIPKWLLWKPRNSLTAQVLLRSCWIFYDITSLARRLCMQKIHKIYYAVSEIRSPSNCLAT